MTDEYIAGIQEKLGLSDTKIAAALGVTRQTFGNWRKGKSCPNFVRIALTCIMELRRIDASNDNLPEGLRVKL